MSRGSKGASGWRHHPHPCKRTQETGPRQEMRGSCSVDLWEEPTTMLVGDRWLTQDDRRGSLEKEWPQTPET